MSVTANYVHILVYDENREPLDVSDRNRWKIEFPPVSGTNYPRGKNDPDRRQPEIYAQSGNKITLVYHVNHHKTEAVAIEYLSKGYGAAVTGSEWPKAGDSAIEVNEQTVSASISVEGGFEAPHELNFYFEAAITTPDGLTMHLFLAQTSDGKGWLHTLRLFEKANRAACKAGLAAYEGKTGRALKQTLKFLRTTKKLFGEKHSSPWLLTVKGTARWPAVTVHDPSDDPEGQARAGQERSVLFVHPAGPQSAGKMQTGRFFWGDPHHPVTDDQHFTFQLQLYKAQDIPQEALDHAPVPGTRIFFVDDRSALYYCDTDETSKYILNIYMTGWGGPLLSERWPTGVSAREDVFCYCTDAHVNHPTDYCYDFEVNRIEKKERLGPFCALNAQPVIDGHDVYFPGQDGIYRFDSDAPAKGPVKIVDWEKPARRLTFYRDPAGKLWIYCLLNSEFMRCGINGERSYMSVWNGSDRVYLDDIQPVICKDHLYFVGTYNDDRDHYHHSLYRLSLTSGKSAPMGDYDHRVGMDWPLLVASPDEQFILYTSDDNAICRVSSHDGEIKKIGQGVKVIRAIAVSSARIFVGSSLGMQALDFDGNDLGMLRVAETGRGVVEVLEFQGQLYGTERGDGGVPMLVRGEIPENPKEDIRFMHLVPGRFVAAVSTV
jgi:hypothetical protein